MNDQSLRLGDAQVRQVWTDFGNLLVRETRSTLLRNGGGGGAEGGSAPSSLVSELEAVALALAQEELSQPTRTRQLDENARAHSHGSGGREHEHQRGDFERQQQQQQQQFREAGERELDRLRREQMATVRAMLDAEAQRESIDDAIRRRDAEATEAQLDRSIAQTTTSLRHQLEKAPKTLRDAAESVERKEAQLRKLLRASNHVAVLEGEAQRCAREYEEQMDRIIRRAATAVKAVADGGNRSSERRRPRHNNRRRHHHHHHNSLGDASRSATVGGVSEVDTHAVVLAPDVEDMLRSFAATLSVHTDSNDDDDDNDNAYHGEGVGRGGAQQLLVGNTGSRFDLHDDDDSAGRGNWGGGGGGGGGASGGDSGRRLATKQRLQPGERASLLRRFDRMMRLFATSCAMEARKIIAESQEQTDRVHQQTLGSVLRDVRLAHIREIGHMRATIDRAHAMLEDLSGRGSAIRDNHNGNGSRR